MLSLEEVFSRFMQSKKELRDLKRSYKDALHNSQQYQELLDQQAELKVKKKMIENEILTEIMDKARHEELSVGIKTDAELLSDIALNKYVAGENVEIVDEYNNRLVPQFKVIFKKS
jgi:hypothetical protein